MGGTDAWDVALLASVSYVAVMALVRMMRWRRDAILDDLSEQMRAQKEQRQRQKKKERQKQLQEETQQRFGTLRDAG